MPPYSNRAHGQRLRRWSYFLMLLGLYEAMYVPLQLSFEEPRDPFGRFRLPALQYAVQCLIDICFIVDIAVRFRTMYVSRADEGNELITDRRKIAHRYLHGYFTIDLLSVVPIDVFASGYNGVRVSPHTHTHLSLSSHAQLLCLYHRYAATPPNSSGLTAASTSSVWSLSIGRR